MDVNGTRFHLLLGPDDWAGPGGTLPPALRCDPDGGALELAGLPFIFPPRRAETPPVPESRRGAGRDRFGNWYWIDASSTAVLARAPGDDRPRRFWPGAEPPASPAGEFVPTSPAPVPASLHLQGLVVTTEHYLVVGAPSLPGLLVFDLAAGGPPVVLRWPADVRFEPWDMTPAPDGGAWILDRENARLWSLDRHFRVRAPALPPPPAPTPPEFEPMAPAGPTDVDPVVEAVRLVTLAASLDVSAVSDRMAVESLCDGSVVVLGADPAAPASAPMPALFRYTMDGPAGVYRVAPLLAEHAAVARQLTSAHDVAFVAAAGCAEDALAGTFFLVATSGNQTFAFLLDGRGPGAAGSDVPGSGDGDSAAPGRLSFVETFYPMRRFGGRGLVAAGGEAHYDSGERWVTLLEQPRPRYEVAGDVVVPPPPGPAADTGAFDGKEPGCVWHRLFLDACIPPGSSVSVESRAADTIHDLTGESWVPQPAPYLRETGSELPWSRGAAPDDGAQTGTWELLFQAVRGRYLQLRLRLRGNGRTSPRVYALRAHYPRFSYLREYLPAVWREDATSASFVDRFLANVEGTLTELEGRIAAAQVLFDTRTAPAEFLPWLAGWLGASLDAAWNEAKRRFFLANALRMYAGRGTRDGLVRSLRLALEACPDPSLFDTDARTGSATSPRFTVRVAEQFLSRSAPGVDYADAGDAAAPSASPADARWSPAQGAGPLHARWREWLTGAYVDAAALNAAWGTDYASLDDPSLLLPATAPAGAGAADWRRFLRQGLDFTYEAPTAPDLPLWRDFLARRYRQPGDLSRAWRRFGNAAVASFETVAYPDTLPAVGAELADWITFVSVVLPMRRGAHRFTVLVPVKLEASLSAQRARRDLAERIASLQKPAHTTVRTRLYWAAFQVGSARLGTDSVLGLGGRFATLVLGSGELAEASLGWVAPWNVSGRRVVGRDPVAIRSRVTRLSTRCT